jgi:hypothetical protein
MNEVQADRFYTSRPIEIPMVEDNPGDVRGTGSGLAMQHYPNSESSWPLTVLLTVE